MKWMEVPIDEKLFCRSYFEFRRMKYCGGIIRAMYSYRFKSIEYWAETESDSGHFKSMSTAMAFLKAHKDEL